MATNIEDAAMSLEEFINQPDTLAFNVVLTKSLQNFVAERPYIKIGPVLGTGFAPVYTNKRNIPELFRELGNSYSLFPAILSPVDAEANEAAGIAPVLNHPYLDLTGRNVIIGFVDTGIDYTQDVFRYEDGTSKIISIWDQSITGPRGHGLLYGAEYSREQINAALESERPWDLVPTRDEDGHGTFLASVAAGRKSEAYVGAAPGAELVVVKLRRANQFFVDQLFLPPDKPNYFHNADVMLGIQYLVDIASERQAPLVICIGLGANDSGHDGYTVLEEYISYLSQRPGCVVITAAGNESNAKHHTQGTLFRTGSTDTIEVRVGEKSASFALNIFSAAYDKMSVGIVSPSGEVISRVPFNVDGATYEELLFEKTRITITYYRTSNTVIALGFRDAKEGVWQIVLYGDSILGGEYHAWLPISYQVSPYVEFLKPVPEYTIVYPGNALRPITCGAYDMRSGNLYAASSWGPTRLPRIAPDFVAPGVQVAGIYPSGPGSMTGTSVSSAVCAGAAALLMEWAVVQEHLVSMDGDLARRLLIGGCRREPEQIYPSIKWGYGKLDLYGTLRRMRESGMAT